MQNSKSPDNSGKYLPRIQTTVIYFNQLYHQQVVRKLKFKCVNEKDLKFDKFGVDKLKEMNKDDDVETDDYLVTGT